MPDTTDPRAIFLAALDKTRQEVAALGLTSDSSAEVTTQRGPSYSYDYLSLGAIKQAVEPILRENGLSWTTRPDVGDDGSPVLAYELRLMSDPEVGLDGRMKLLLGGREDSQGHGSAITYARRYCLTAVLDLVVEHDDDGARASGGAQATGRGRGGTERIASPLQRGLMNGKANEAQLTSEQYAKVIADAAGVEVSAQVFADEEKAREFIAREAARLPAAKVDAVLAGIAAVQS